ncbi:MAG: hypothetical protein IJS42_02485 [Synergistaceae bacterium]|nr:hypothetical protein [Synergistaceae bacterium]
MGSVIDAEFCDAAGEILNDNESQHSEFIVESLKSGNDTGIKAAAAGALKSATEKQLIPFMSEDTCAGVAYMAMEKLKAALKKAPLVEYIEAVERNALAVAGGYIAVSKEASIGAHIGSMFGFVGTAAGGIIGAATGYIAGTKVTYAVAEKFQEVRRRITDRIETYAAPVFRKTVESIKSVGKKVLSRLFG